MRGNAGTASSRQGFVGGLGHVSDMETGLVYMRARYCDPQQGRFSSEDPGKHGSNWFVYCNNNPTNQIDQDGKEATPWDLFLAGLGTIIAGATLLLTAICAYAALETLAATVAIAIGTAGLICAVGALIGIAAVFIGLALLGAAAGMEIRQLQDANKSTSSAFSIGVPIVSGLPLGEAIAIATFEADSNGDE